MIVDTGERQFGIKKPQLMHCGPPRVPLPRKAHSRWTCLNQKSKILSITLLSILPINPKHTLIQQNLHPANSAIGEGSP